MGLSTGLDSKGASSLLNMNIGMKKNESSNMNMTDGISGHSFDKMNSMFANNQSSSYVLNQSTKEVKILVSYETSNLAELLKILFTNSLFTNSLQNLYSLTLY